MELVLDYVASRIAKTEQMLASELGIENSTLERLQGEYPLHPHERTFHILYIWMINNPVIDHMQTLRKALQSLDRNDIEHDLFEFKKHNYKCNDVVDSHLTLENEEVEIVASKLAGNNYRMGRFLGIPQTRISQIKVDNTKHIVEQTYQMLDWWRRNQQSRATRQNLCDGLVYVGQRNVVDILLKKWDSK